MKHKWLFGLTLAGLLFAGYLSGVKFFTDTCAFGEGCPLFLGYPACYFGFAMYFIMTMFVLFAQFEKLGERAMLTYLSIVSFLGILFAGYFTFGELPKLANEGLGAYLLGLPTCAYGLVVYIAIFTIAINSLRKVSA